MEREIKLIFTLALFFTVVGFFLILGFSSLKNALLFFLGGSIMAVHFTAIRGIAGKLTGKRGKRAALHMLSFMLTIGVVALLTFYLLKFGKLMVVYFLSGTLTLALAANVVMIKILLRGSKDA